MFYHFRTLILDNMFPKIQWRTIMKWDLSSITHYLYWVNYFFPLLNLAIHNLGYPHQGRSIRAILDMFFTTSSGMWPTHRVKASKLRGFIIWKDDGSNLKIEEAETIFQPLYSEDTFRVVCPRSKNVAGGKCKILEIKRVL